MLIIELYISLLICREESMLQPGEEDDVESTRSSHTSIYRVIDPVSQSSRLQAFGSPRKAQAVIVCCFQA
jgi:hypothetical protein